jgi:hypothetical protein
MKRSTFFQTDDGYTLRWDPKRRIWSDGDLVFQSDKDGYPLDHTGKWLEGVTVARKEISREP